MYGGGGYQHRGGAGTVFRNDTFKGTPYIELLTDNGGFVVSVYTPGMKYIGGI